METLKWYHDENGKPSTVRIIAMMGAILGIIISLGGLVGFFMRLTDSIQVIGLGVGVFGVSEFTKALQKRSERNGDHREADYP
jgi:hypothetical protein